jgi:hypothetical protein
MNEELSNSRTLAEISKEKDVNCVFTWLAGAPATIPDMKWIRLLQPILVATIQFHTTRPHQARRGLATDPELPSRRGRNVPRP